jgi:hypothetical protein
MKLTEIANRLREVAASIESVAMRTDEVIAEVESSGKADRGLVRFPNKPGVGADLGYNTRK